MSTETKEFLKSLLLVVFSALTASISIHGFVNPANLYPAGFVGIAKLVTEILAKYFNIHIQYLLLYLVIQIVLTILVMKYIGKRFAILTTIQFTIVSLSDLFIPNFHIVDDRILLVLFGGMITGISSILALKAKASGGGTDYIAIYTQNHHPHVPIWDYIMYLNWAVLLVAGFIFGFEAAMYSMIFQFVSTTIINNMDSRHKLNGLYIITEYEDDVAEAIFSKFSRGITKLWGEGAYTKTPKTMLFMVVNAFEVEEVCRIILSIDEQAFINVTKSERVVGNFVRHKIT